MLRVLLARAPTWQVSRVALHRSFTSAAEGGKKKDTATKKEQAVLSEATKITHKLHSKRMVGKGQGGEKGAWDSKRNRVVV